MALAIAEVRTREGHRRVLSKLGPIQCPDQINPPEVPKSRRPPVQRPLHLVWIFPVLRYSVRNLVLLLPGGSRRLFRG